MYRIDNKGIGKHIYPAKGNSETVSRHIFAGQYLFRGAIVHEMLQQGIADSYCKRYIKKILEPDTLTDLCHHLQSEGYIPLNKTGARSELVALAYIGFSYLNNIEDRQEEVKQYLAEAYLNYCARDIQPGDLDIWTKLIAICNQFLDTTPSIHTEKADDLYHTILILDDELIFQHSHKKFKTSRSRAIQQALTHMLDVSENLFENDEAYRTYIAQKNEAIANVKAEEKRKRAEKHEQYISDRNAARIERKKRWKEKEEIKIKLRLQRKNRSKAAKRMKQAEQEKFLKMLTNISSRKRRILEDKGIISARK